MSCNLIFHILTPYSQLSQDLPQHVMSLQFHIGYVGRGMTVITLSCRTALFALIHPDKDNGGQLSRTTDSIITLGGLCDRYAPTKACQEKPIRTLN